MIRLLLFEVLDKGHENNFYRVGYPQEYYTQYDISQMSNNLVQLIRDHNHMMQVNELYIGNKRELRYQISNFLGVN